MGVSLEGRVPILDHEFVELAMSIPQKAKTDGGTLKHILKKAVRGVIPDELIDRPKQGFGVPVHEWMTSQLGDYTRDTVGRFARETDFLDEDATDGLMASDHSPDKWRLLNLALWWQECIA